MNDKSMTYSGCDDKKGVDVKVIHHAFNLHTLFIAVIHFIVDSTQNPTFCYFIMHCEEFSFCCIDD